MKRVAFFLLLALGLVLPWACTNSAPTGPLATYNLTATFTNTVTLTPTNWAGYTSTATRVPGVITNTPTMTMTMTNTQTPTNTFTPTKTPSGPTPVATGGAWTANKAPNGLAYDGTRYVYAAEGTENQTGGQIEVFDTTTGHSVATVTTYNSTALVQPNGVAYYSGSLYVVDQGSSVAYKYQINLTAGVYTSLTASAAVSTLASGPASLLNPQGITADSTGNIYIADTGNDYIEILGSSFSNVPSVVFNNGGNFNNISSVAVNSAASTIYVADQGNQQVEMFNSSGTLLGQFSTGTNSGVYGITVDGSGKVYVADSDAGIVKEYDSTSSPAGAFITSGLGITANNISPDGLVFLGANLLVADYSNDALYLVTP